ncbi:MAG TPA: hypothetical protein VIY69_07910 [Candidatus Acidoferrales bacterium]
MSSADQATGKPTQPPSTKSWACRIALGGLVAPVLYLTIHLLTGYSPGEGIFIFWPGAVGLMVLENRPAIYIVLIVWTVAIASNIVLYGGIGALFASLDRFEPKT